MRSMFTLETVKTPSTRILTSELTSTGLHFTLLQCRNIVVQDKWIHGAKNVNVKLPNTCYIHFK